MDITATTSAAASLGAHRPQGPPPRPNMDGTAELLGTDASTLLEKLRSGEDITEWLESLKSQTGYGESETSAGGLQVDTYA